MKLQMPSAGKKPGWPKKKESGSLPMEKSPPKQKSFPQIYVPSLPMLWIMPWNIWKIPDLPIPGSISGSRIREIFSAWFLKILSQITLFSLWKEKPPKIPSTIRDLDFPISARLWKDTRGLSGQKFPLNKTAKSFAWRFFYKPEISVRNKIPAIHNKKIQEAKFFLYSYLKRMKGVCL